MAKCKNVFLLVNVLDIILLAIFLVIYNALNVDIPVYNALTFHFVCPAQQEYIIKDLVKLHALPHILLINLIPLKFNANLAPQIA